MTNTAPTRTVENESVAVDLVEDYHMAQTGDKSENDAVFEISYVSEFRQESFRELETTNAGNTENAESGNSNFLSYRNFYLTRPLLTRKRNIFTSDSTPSDTKASSSQQLTSVASTSSCELNSSQEMLSQLSIGTRLPVINSALKLLDESPIPRKKLKSSKWVENKVAQVCCNLKRTCEVPNAGPVDQNDTRDLLDIVGRLKQKLHQEGTTRAEKIQILTILPQYWSAQLMCEIMDVSKHMVLTAKKLEQTTGILSMPHAKAG